MAEAPGLKVLLDIDELFAHLIGFPVCARVGVDLAEDADDGVGARVGLRPVALSRLRRNRIAVSREVAQKFVVETWRMQCALEFAVNLWVMFEDFDRGG